MSDLHQLQGEEELVVALGIAREFTLLHLFFISSQRLERVGFEVGIRLHEFRDERIKESEEIIEHEHLTVTVRSRPNPDRRD